MERGEQPIAKTGIVAALFKKRLLFTRDSLRLQHQLRRCKELQRGAAAIAQSARLEFAEDPEFES